ncbi:MAG: hypothetical protein A6F70_08140 [Cycloclasticus sp. symbiont of Bathymodiolus heckerae]|nr:MAG: hypothetical protein A6F70_08140 [Cycloclasticus sp. symbiont of Bathymodiolus heckerae]
MPQVINTNVASLTAQRNLNTSQNALNTSLERLSSGLRINSAKDDAAGLAISERFTTQIRGLNQAQRNANDGISLAQTAEGDLAQITNNLQRIRELAVQSANATNSASDRAALQLETSQLIAEIDRVAQNSEFNGVRLLDGGFATQQFQVGANADQTVNIDSIASARTLSLGQTFSATLGTAGTAVQSGFTDGDLTVNGFAITSSADAAAIAAEITAADASLTATATNVQSAIAFSDVVGIVAAAEVVGTGAQSGPISDVTYNGADAGFDVDGQTVALTTDFATDTAGGVALAAAIELQLTDITVTATGDQGSGDLALTFARTSGTAAIAVGSFTGTAAASGYGADAGTVGTVGTATITAEAPDFTLTLDGTTLDFSTTGLDGTIDAADVAAAIIAADIGYTGVSADTATSIAFTKTDGSNAVFVEGGTDAGDELSTYIGNIATLVSSDGDIVIAGSTAANAGLTAGTTTASTTLSGTTIAGTDISTVAGANAALVSVTSALSTISTSRASLGAIQNRFESVVSSIQTTSENLSAARSRIRDADFAEETAALTRAQILQQAGVSILSQANSLPQNVLALLQ